MSAELNRFGVFAAAGSVVDTLNTESTYAEPDRMVHYVDGLDAEGDNFLALRTEPSSRTGRRIEKMPPGTELEVLKGKGREERGRQGLEKKERREGKRRDERGREEKRGEDRDWRKRREKKG